MAEQAAKKPGLAGQVLPFLLVVLLGAGAGFAGFKSGGTPASKQPAAAKTPTSVKLAVEVSGKSEKSAASGSAHGEKSGLSKQEAETQAHEAALLAEELKARKLELADANIVPMPPLIANIASPSTTWIRLEASLAVSKAAAGKPADIAQMVSPKILAYLKTLKIADVQGASGMEFVSADIDEIARAASDGQVKAVFLTGFVIE